MKTDIIDLLSKDGKDCLDKMAFGRSSYRPSSISYRAYYADGSVKITFKSIYQTWNYFWRFLKLVNYMFMLRKLELNLREHILSFSLVGFSSGQVKADYVCFKKMLRDIARGSVDELQISYSWEDRSVKLSDEN